MRLFQRFFCCTDVRRSDGNLTVKQEITTEEEAQAALEQDQISGYLMVDVDGDQLKGSLVHEDLTTIFQLLNRCLRMPKFYYEPMN